MVKAGAHRFSSAARAVDMHIDAEHHPGARRSAHRGKLRRRLGQGRQAGDFKASPVSDPEGMKATVVKPPLVGVRSSLSAISAISAGTEQERLCQLTHKTGTTVRPSSARPKVVFGARRELASPNRRKRPLAALERPIGAEMPASARRPNSNIDRRRWRVASGAVSGTWPQQTQRRCDDNTKALRAPKSDVQPVRAVEKFHSARRVGVTGSRHGIDDDRGFLTLKHSRRYRCEPQVCAPEARTPARCTERMIRRSSSAIREFDPGSIDPPRSGRAEIVL